MVKTQRGYALVAVLIAVAICSATAATVFQLQRIRIATMEAQNEAWIKQAYRDAFKSFYNAVPEGNRRLPNNIDELLLDTRFATLRRHLRAAYKRPDTMEIDWDWVLKISEENSALILNSALGNS